MENKNTKKEEEVKAELPENVTISKNEWDAVQTRLKMLYDVADKGRVFNYEANRAEKRPMKVKLSVHNDGIIVGWEMGRDELIKNPTTGLVVGEVQEISLKVLDKEGKTGIVKVNGYPAFSDIRYRNQIEAEVTGRRENWDGTRVFDLKLPDGRSLSLDERLLN